MTDSRARASPETANVAVVNIPAPLARMHVVFGVLFVLAGLLAPDAAAALAFGFGMVAFTGLQIANMMILKPRFRKASWRFDRRPWSFLVSSGGLFVLVLKYADANGTLDALRALLT